MNAQLGSCNALANSLQDLSEDSSSDRAPPRAPSRSRSTLERSSTSPKSYFGLIEEGATEKNSDEEISFFLRDEQTGRYLFNATAPRALGVNPVQAQQRGYSFKEQAEARDATNPNR